MENKLLSAVNFFNDITNEDNFNLYYQAILCDIACHIINYRLKNNMTQKEFSDKIKIPKRKLARIESAEYDIKLNLLFKILNEINMQIKIY